MNPIRDRELAWYTTNLLEPDRTADVERALLRSPDARERLAVVTAELRMDEVFDEPVARDEDLRVPPPGIAGGRGAFIVSTVAADVMSGVGVRPGERYRIRLAPVADAAARQVVVLRRATQGWDIAYPNHPDEVLPLEALEEDARGARHLDLIARGPGGRQRWAVALPPLALLVDWEARGMGRWGALRENLAAGRVPVAAVDIVVQD